MVKHHNLQGAICHRLSVFGVPAAYHKAFASMVDRWVLCSGVEWTVKRLKSLKVDLYRIRSGLKPLTPAAKTCKGRFKGVVGSLFVYANKSERCFQAVVHTFMVYSLFKHDSLSRAQQEKFVAAVNANTTKYTPTFLEGFATFVKSLYTRKIKIGEPSPILFHRGSQSKKAPMLGGRSVSQDNAGLSSLSYFATTAHYELFNKYPSLYGPITQGVDIHTFKESVRSADIPNDSVCLGGEVHFLQEPGLKLRAIASPYLVHQEALRPLGRALYSVLQDSPWDCTHNHMKPVSHVQQHLSSGRLVHSVDLSNATDYFPLEVQLEALKGLIGSHPSIDLFHEISRSTWLSAIGPIIWKQGQPLGLYPSFASFGLTHGLILLYLLGKRYAGEFYVLGDDVIILDDTLYTKYMECLDNLGCPFSPDKSLSSSELCEFGGKVITSTAVIPQYKWRELSNDNFLDIVRNYGRRAVSLLSSSQKAVVDRVQHLVAPIGLNWSKPGSNLDSMTEDTCLIYRKVERDEQSLTELYTTLQGSWYSVPSPKHVALLSSLLKWSVNTDTLLELARTFDEKVSVTLAHVFPKEWVDAIQANHLVGAYAGVPRAVGLTNLPLETEPCSRVTTLDRYRKLLHLK